MKRTSDDETRPPDSGEVPPPFDVDPRLLREREKRRKPREAEIRKIVDKIKSRSAAVRP